MKSRHTRQSSTAPRVEKGEESVLELVKDQVCWSRLASEPRHVVPTRLYTAMSKTKAHFEITAYDGKGLRRPYGGDNFAVSVRGASYVYAKVIDNNDGSYRVDYKPSTSGSYTIAITLAGRSREGSHEAPAQASNRRPRTCRRRRRPRRRGHSPISPLLFLTLTNLVE